MMLFNPVITMSEAAQLITLPLERSGRLYCNRRGEQVQIIENLSCGLRTVWALRRQLEYYINDQGKHRSQPELDLVCDWNKRSEVPKEEWTVPKKKRNSEPSKKVKAAKLWPELVGKVKVYGSCNRNPPLSGHPDRVWTWSSPKNRWYLVDRAFFTQGAGWNGVRASWGSTPVLEKTEIYDE